MDNAMTAACGLDCGTCEIRLAPVDPAAAQTVVAWFRRQGWLTQDEGIEQVLARKMYCCGCLADRTIHWSTDCWILQCCADQHSLRSCSQCEQFPCEQLVEWAEQDESYGKALKRLKGLRRAHAEGRG